MTQKFGVATDGGLDAFTNLKNNVPVAPFAVNFGTKSYRTHELSREALFWKRTQFIQPAASPARRSGSRPFGKPPSAAAAMKCWL